MKYLLLTCALIAAVAADVSHLPSNQYLPPHHAATAPEPSYAAAPAPSYHAAATYEAPAASYQVAASAPAYQSVSYEGGAGGAGGASYEVAASAPAETYHAAPAAPAPVYHAAPAPAYQPEASAVHTVEAAPAHTYSDAEGYRYKTHRRVVYRQRRRRDVSHLSNEYLPPFQGSASVGIPSQDYLPPQATNVVQDYAPAPAVEYETAPSEVAPAHSYSSDSGYRYRTNRRRVYRRRRY